jgi:hypothetical protein
MNHFNMMDQANLLVFLSTLSDEYVAMPPVVPADPTDLIGKAISMNQVDLTWTDNAANETGFRIERALITGGTPGEFAVIGRTDTDVTNFSDMSGTANTSYAYRVFAFNTNGDSLPTNVVTVTTLDFPPADPINLIATLQSSLQTGPRIRLVFRDNAVDETGFVVERSDNDGTFATIENLPPRAKKGNVTYTDTSVLAGQKYTYRVFAVKGITPSAYSNIAIVRVPPAPEAPSNFTATTKVINGGASIRVNMTWTDNSINESRFVIQRASDPDFTVNLNSFNVGANKIAFTQTGLSRGTTYYYRIMAQNAYGQSAWANLTPFPIVTP